MDLDGSYFHADNCDYDGLHSKEERDERRKERFLYRSLENSNKILQGFNICSIAPKINVFSAGRAKLIINKYLSEYDTIFDLFSGFSGRMLGTISLGKNILDKIYQIYVL